MVNHPLSTPFFHPPNWKQSSQASSANNKANMKKVQSEIKIIHKRELFHPFQLSSYPRIFPSLQIMANNTFSSETHKFFPLSPALPPFLCFFVSSSSLRFWIVNRKKKTHKTETDEGQGSAREEKNLYGKIMCVFEPHTFFFSFEHIFHTFFPNVREKLLKKYFVVNRVQKEFGIRSRKNFFVCKKMRLLSYIIRFHSDVIFCELSSSWIRWMKIHEKITSSYAMMTKIQSRTFALACVACRAIFITVTAKYKNSQLEWGVCLLLLKSYSGIREQSLFIFLLTFMLAPSILRLCSC